jgi:hypothetical protein
VAEFRFNERRSAIGEEIRRRFGKRRSLVLLAEQNQNSRDQSQDGNKDTGGAERYSEDADDADENQVEGQQEHANVFGNHAAMVTRPKKLSRANVSSKGKAGADHP